MENSENGVSTELDLERKVKEQLLSATRAAQELYDCDVAAYLRGLDQIDDHSPITANFKDVIRGIFSADESDTRFYNAMKTTQGILKG